MNKVVFDNSDRSNHLEHFFFTKGVSQKKNGANILLTNMFHNNKGARKSLFFSISSL
jgi:hypothetical protein